MYLTSISIKEEMLHSDPLQVSLPAITSFSKYSCRLDLSSFSYSASSLIALSDTQNTTIIEASNGLISHPKISTMTL